MITLNDALELWGDAMLARERGDIASAEATECFLLGQLRELEQANEEAGLKFIDMTGMATENIAAMLLAKAGEIKPQ